MSSFLSTEDDLKDLTDIWLRILLWAFITTTLVYSTGGIYSELTWRRTKPMAFVCPLLYLLFGAVKFVIVDLITCLLIASIYNAASWETSGLAAFGWGIGLSLDCHLGCVISTQEDIVDTLKSYMDIGSTCLTFMSQDVEMDI